MWAAILNCMELRYEDLTKERLRAWRDNDQVLYDATVDQLQRIKGNPDRHGADGTPFVSRLVSFSVGGRDEQYVITWEVDGEDIRIGEICSVSELQQRARLRNDPLG